MDNSAPAVAQLAPRCLSLFDKTLSVPILSQNGWAENRRADFNLWADSVGAMAYEKASLDSRFEHGRREIKLTISLLSKLMFALEECLKPEDVAYLEKAKKNVDALIENLALIASAIRRTGRKSRLGKADKTYDPSAVEDLQTHLRCISLLRPSTLEGTASEEREPLWWSKEISGELSSLQHRLIEANLCRRNRFIYAQKHSMKLAQRKPQTTGIIRMESDTDALVPLHEDIIPVPGNASQIDPRPKLKINNPLSETTASRPESTSATSSSSSERQQKTPRTKTEITSITGGTEYPKLASPKDTGTLGRQKILKCPCCCEPLPLSMLESKVAWK